MARPASHQSSRIAALSEAEEALDDKDRAAKTVMEEAKPKEFEARPASHQSSRVAALSEAGEALDDKDRAAKAVREKANPMKVEARPVSQASSRPEELTHALRDRDQPQDVMGDGVRLSINDEESANTIAPPNRPKTPEQIKSRRPGIKNDQALDSKLKEQAEVDRDENQNSELLKKQSEIDSIKKPVNKLDQGALVEELGEEVNPAIIGQSKFTQNNENDDVGPKFYGDNRQNFSINSPNKTAPQNNENYENNQTIRSESPEIKSRQANRKNESVTDSDNEKNSELQGKFLKTKVIQVQPRPTSSSDPNLKEGIAFDNGSSLKDNSVERSPEKDPKIPLLPKNCIAPDQNNITLANGFNTLQQQHEFIAKLSANDLLKYQEELKTQQAEAIKSIGKLLANESVALTNKTLTADNNKNIENIIRNITAINKFNINLVQWKQKDENKQETNTSLALEWNKPYLSSIREQIIKSFTDAKKAKILEYLTELTNKLELANNNQQKLPNDVTNVLTELTNHQGFKEIFNQETVKIKQLLDNNKLLTNVDEKDLFNKQIRQPPEINKSPNRVAYSSKTPEELRAVDDDSAELRKANAREEAKQIKAKDRPASLASVSPSELSPEEKPVDTEPSYRAQTPKRPTTLPPLSPKPSMLKDSNLPEELIGNGEGLSVESVIDTPKPEPNLEPEVQYKSSEQIQDISTTTITKAQQVLQEYSEVMPKVMKTNEEENNIDSTTIASKIMKELAAAVKNPAITVESIPFDQFLNNFKQDQTQKFQELTKIIKTAEQDETISLKIIGINNLLKLKNTGSITEAEELSLTNLQLELKQYCQEQKILADSTSDNKDFLEYLNAAILYNNLKIEQDNDKKNTVVVTNNQNQKVLEMIKDDPNSNGLKIQAGDSKPSNATLAQIAMYAKEALDAAGRTDRRIAVTGNDPESAIKLYLFSKTLKLTPELSKKNNLDKAVEEFITQADNKADNSHGLSEATKQLISIYKDYKEKDITDPRVHNDLLKAMQTWENLEKSNDLTLSSSRPATLKSHRFT